ncbi:unnamed protein product [Eruca vesicaria subsp. sativa]|uniref:Uncharacterized protein n=1 Tax=Eruca vesicaria subsp. sativa TaxID=29727 RepID=A0ABC8JNY9_ERUVS|nr:unnamed protein product [Eruca vesicaria subsp. sativa]
MESFMHVSLFGWAGKRTMGQDYSYTQPSSSEEFDMNSLLEAEAALYADEGDRRVSEDLNISV